jgi:DNA topoisomerase-1
VLSALPAEVPSGLIYADRMAPGISRHATKDGFSYRDAEGKAIKDDKTLARIKALVIPPAWADVWICPSPRGHIQATGKDKRGRLQYRYHAKWRESRDGAKYDRMSDFGKKLPALRAQVNHDLAKRGLPQEKVLAAVVRLLELTLIRVGNEEYAKTNKSFGLTTFRDKHVSFTGAGAVFEFRGKSGVEHRTGFKDRRLARIVKACQDLPGQRLFQYVDADGVRHGVTSADVNFYIQAGMGEDFSAKDFRTWWGGLAAMHVFEEAGKPSSDMQAKAMVREGVKQVSQLLGNTPAVCRKCYIHPAVIRAYESGRLTRPRAGADPERRLLKILAL